MAATTFLLQMLNKYFVMRYDFKSATISHLSRRNILKIHLALLIPLIFLVPLPSLAASERATAEKIGDQQIVDKYNQTVATKKDKVICKYVRKTGTHFKTRICRTVFQIEEERKQALRDHGDALSGGLSATSEN